MMRTSLLVIVLSLLLAACGNGVEDSTSTGEDIPAAGDAEPPAADPKVTATVQKVADSENTDIPAPDDVAAAPADAQRTASGLAYKVLQAGGGTEHPAASDTVEVHYTGWMIDGKMFDSSVQRGQTAKFPLNMVIPGWTEGVQLMVVGEKARFWIPVELAYQNKPGKPMGMLVFDIELLAIEE